MKIGEDVLLPIGSIVEVEPNNDDITKFMIIGKRCINPESMRSWDYVSVPYEEGYKRKIDKREDKIRTYENLFYFNHYEIDGIISIAKIKTKPKDK